MKEKEIFKAVMENATPESLRDFLNRARVLFVTSDGMGVLIFNIDQPMLMLQNPTRTIDFDPTKISGFVLPELDEFENPETVLLRHQMDRAEQKIEKLEAEAKAEAKTETNQKGLTSSKDLEPPEFFGGAEAEVDGPLKDIHSK
jgi:hypothetical protein